MKKVILGCVLGALIAVAAAEPTMTETFALTTIDMLPTRGQLDGALGSAQEPTSDRLIAIAEDGSDDTGVRLRAISALPRYCPCGSDTSVHDALASLIPADSSQLSGKDLVLLRAAIESLAVIRPADPADTPKIEGLLNHPSRDIRASAARALAAMCDSSAINALRVRYQNESTDQVKLAISAALRTLPCPVN
jgi:HEAT repeat protein